MNSKGKKEPKPQPGASEFENGIKLWDAGRIEEALSEFLAAGAKGFRSDAIENNIGAAYERQGRIDEAIAHYKLALRANPKNFFALKNTAELLGSKDRWPEARRYFSRALREDPNDSSTRLNYIRCLAALGNLGRAKKEATEMLERRADAKMMLEMLSILREVEAFDVIADLLPLFPPEVQESREFLKICGETYLELGATGDAINCLNKSLGKGGDPVAKSWLGLAEMSMGNEDRGLALLKEAVEEDGNNLQILRNMSFALHGKDKLEEALSIYEKAVSLYPDEFVMWNNWGNALYNLHRYVESIPKFVTAIEKNQDYEIAWNNIGNALEKMKLYKESLPYHYRAIDINEDFDYAHYAAAEALLMTGDREEAVLELDKALMVGPSFPEAWDLKARVLINTTPEVGITFAQKAIDADPDSARSIITLSMCQMMAGMPVDAERNLRLARKVAEAVNDEKAIKEIDEIVAGGVAAIAKLLSHEGLPAEAVEAEEARSDAEKAFQLYKRGTEQQSRGKVGRSADLYSMAFELDDHSSAIAYALLKNERDKERLKKYLEGSIRIQSAGLATPGLKKAMEEAALTIETAVLDRSSGGK